MSIPIRKAFLTNMYATNCLVSKGLINKPCLYHCVTLCSRMGQLQVLYILLGRRRIVAQYVFRASLSCGGGWWWLLALQLGWATKCGHYFFSRSDRLSPTWRPSASNLFFVFCQIYEVCLKKWISKITSFMF